MLGNTTIVPIYYFRGNESFWEEQVNPEKDCEYKFYHYDRTAKTYLTPVCKTQAEHEEYREREEERGTKAIWIIVSVLVVAIGIGVWINW